jgi:hypothetical protein
MEVVDIFQHGASRTRRHRDVVEHRQVLDHLAQPDPARVRAHSDAELGVQAVVR